MDEDLTDIHRRATGSDEHVERSFVTDIVRYVFDEMFTEEKGWQEFRTDQDCFGHFSIRGNRDSFELAAYIDGTLCQATCFDAESYQREVKRLCDYAGAALETDVLDPEEEYYRDWEGFLYGRDGPER